MDILRRHIDFEYLTKNGVVKSHFPCHLHERAHIIPSWNKYRMRLAFGFVTGSFTDNMQPLNVIKDYYGEKLGFFFAWLMHYTGWLLIGSVLGLMFSFIAFGFWS